jgi:integrase/recombinase XerD
MGFSEFVRERQYLQNVTPATLDWCNCSFRWLPSEAPTQEPLKDTVLRMREKGLKATGCNSVIRAINTYLHWVNVGSNVKCSPVCKHPKIVQLKEPQLVLPIHRCACQAACGVEAEREVSMPSARPRALSLGHRLQDQ